MQEPVSGGSSKGKWEYMYTYGPYAFFLILPQVIGKLYKLFRLLSIQLMLLSMATNRHLNDI